MQIFNQINARKIKDEYNPFSGLVGGAAFLYILLIEVILQVRSTAQHCNVHNAVALSIFCVKCIAAAIATGSLNLWHRVGCISGSLKVST